MAFTHHCPNCHSKLNIEQRLSGRTVKCPKCQSTLTIPEANGVKKKVPPADGLTSSARAVQTPTELPERLGGTRQPIAGRGYTLWVVAGTIVVVLLGGIAYWLKPGGEGTGDAGIAHSGQPTAGQPLAAHGSLPPPGDGSPVLAGEGRPRVTNPPAGNGSDGIGHTPLKILPIDTSGWESFPPKNPFGIYVRFPSKPEASTCWKMSSPARIGSSARLC